MIEETGYTPSAATRTVKASDDCIGVILGDVSKPFAAKALKGIEEEAHEAGYQVIVGNNEIHRINLEQRGIDRPTDVLSFPMVEYEKPGCFDGLEEDPAAFHPDSGELMLGDIVISMDKAKEQAEAYGHSLEREYAFLIAHSMLHLFGYDHMEDEERAVMEEKQEEILQLVHYTRD